MKKFIVTTTINAPTEATIKFCEIAHKKNWQFIIIGDTKTPHQLYYNLEKEFKNVLYLDPEQQEKQFKELSSILGWKTIQRRNIGFVYCFKQGADILATVDDDNIPYSTWGDDLFVYKNIECDYYTTDNIVFDPLSVTNVNHLWHRGVPIEIIPVKNNIVFSGKTKRKVLIQADLWDGDPDIDAIARLSNMPIVRFNIKQPFCSNKISPFNSQNTFLAREIIPHFPVLPYVGRMDDIWASYSVQVHFKENLIYAPASVYQNRNKQDLITNLEKEIIGYRNTLKFIESNCNYSCNFIPEQTKEFLKIYSKCFNF